MVNDTHFLLESDTGLVAQEFDRARRLAVTESGEGSDPTGLVRAGERDFADGAVAVDFKRHAGRPEFVRPLLSLTAVGCQDSGQQHGPEAKG